MVESARLESVYMLIAYRGFESLRHRQTLKILYRLLPMWDFLYELMGALLAEYVKPIWDFFMSLLVVLAEYIK